MLDTILDVLLDTILDSLKILPFLFVTYLLMEYLEHKTSNKTKNVIKKSGKFGPIIGGFLGAVPQCGFSVAATNFYAGRIITIGTLISIYLSTSDEMLPILISEKQNIWLILELLAIKVAIGIFFGTVIDLILRFTKKKKEEKEEKHEEHIKHMCEHEHCHCEEDGIFKSSLKHTISIFIYIFIISLVLNIAIEFIGEDRISSIISNNMFLGPVVASLIGLIPNCASSVVLTQLYISGIVNAATMIAGLLVNAGLGLVVLFRVNKNIKENLKIVLTLYIIGVISGILLGFIL